MFSINKYVLIPIYISIRQCAYKNNAISQIVFMLLKLYEYAPSSYTILMIPYIILLHILFVHMSKIH